ncbi:ileal sodium/bile acid cotransporter-like [Dermacentor andersoni]|uniref:ileal sodium/bile acid cotransporter-like n=1 Tax=Dermacentor andersoni TaxID=34620 RepID=UPI0021557688|nr:sodium-dependent organic anion transporter-like [Dermacentor andersoni]
MWLLRSCAAVLLLAQSSTCILNFTSPETRLQLYEPVNLTFRFTQKKSNATVVLQSSDPSVVQLSEDGIALSLERVAPSDNLSTLLTPLKIGYANLLWQVEDSNTNETFKGIHKMRVVRELTVFSMGFGAVIGVLVALNNVNVGCQLDMRVVLSQIKRPVAPAIGMFCQFIFMPLISYGSSTLLLQNPVTRLGLFTIGSCPGGIYSNFYTLLFEGDLDLSVTMTFMSSVGALALMPLWMHTLGRQIAGTATPAVPFSNLFVSLVALTLPLGLGLLIQYKRPKWAQVAEKIVKPFSVAILLVALVIGTYTYWYIVTLITLMEVVAASVVVVTGFLFGATMAWLFRLTSKQIIAVSLETAIQNGPLAIVILTFSLPEPSGDLAVVPVVVLVTLASAILLTVFAILTVRRRCSSYAYACQDNAKSEMPVN